MDQDSAWGGIPARPLAGFCRKIRLQNALAKPRRGGKTVAGGTSPRIGYCIEGVPAGATDLCLQQFPVAPPRLRVAFRSNRLALLLGAAFRPRLATGALALRYPSPPSGWGKTFTSKLSYNARHTYYLAAPTGLGWRSERVSRQKAARESLRHNHPARCGIFLRIGTAPGNLQNCDNCGARPGQTGIG